MTKTPSTTELPPGLAQPAIRALTSAGFTTLEKLREVREAEVRKLHGVGPRAIETLRAALAAKGWHFAEPE